MPLREIEAGGEELGEVGSRGAPLTASVESMLHGGHDPATGRGVLAEGGPHRFACLREIGGPLNSGTGRALLHDADFVLLLAAAQVPRREQARFVGPRDRGIPAEGARGGSPVPQREGASAAATDLQAWPALPVEGDLQAQVEDPPGREIPLLAGVHDEEDEDRAGECIADQIEEAEDVETRDGLHSVAPLAITRSKAAPRSEANHPGREESGSPHSARNQAPPHRGGPSVSSSARPAENSNSYTSGSPPRPRSSTRIATGSNCIRIEIRGPSEGDESLEIALEEQSGRLLGGIARRGWAAELPPELRTALRNALSGFYKLCGVEILREQIDAALGKGRIPYDVTEAGLVVWPGEGFAQEVRYDLADRPSLRAKSKFGDCPSEIREIPAEDAIFRESDIAWRDWVRAWETATVPAPMLLMRVPVLGI